MPTLSLHPRTKHTRALARGAYILEIGDRPYSRQNTSVTVTQCAELWAKETVQQGRAIGSAVWIVSLSEEAASERGLEKVADECPLS